MEEYFTRSEALLGAETMEALRTVRVLIVGVGGVGSWCAEALVRTGLVHLTIMDGDTVQPSNLNRQLPATRQTMGREKVEALRERLLTIHPEADIVAIPDFYHGEEDLSSYDYVIDAIDNVADKTSLLLAASHHKGIKVFSSMGAALRFDPTQVRVAELMAVKGDALCKAVKARMKRLNRYPNKKIRCVYSLEQAQACASRGSLMQVTAVFGCTLASLVVDDVHRRCSDGHSDPRTGTAQCVSNTSCRPD